MKRIICLMLVLLTLLMSSLSLYSCELIFGDNNGNNNGNGNGNGGGDYTSNCSAGDHIDKDNNKYCDACSEYVIVVIDFYALNDLHGKFCDSANQPGVDELGTYLKNRENIDDNVVILSSGDMWQGTAESNLTRGFILTEWMNEMNVVSMTLGNHEFDWGENDIRANLEVAEFPFLAINVYDRATNKLADYCTPSVMIERGGIQIGIIGAIGDCYSSISSDMVEGVRFKVGAELTSLVMAESDRLREMGADLIVYSLHDGYGRSNSGASDVSSYEISGYYDTDLSDGYVDLVFEAHSHQGYTLIDPNGVYHIQGGGENYGVSHVEIEVNSANKSNRVNEAGIVRNSSYSSLEDDPATEAIEDKYSEIIDYAYADLGVVSKTYSDSEIEDYVAELYLEKGIKKWGEDYQIILGGGFLRTRSPYNLSAGIKTYADILSLLPFDNRLVLCSVLGHNLKRNFINSTNDDYHIALSEYGDSVAESIEDYETYYVVVDTYTALYSRNGLRIVEYYDNSTYARDLLAEKIKEGALEIKQDSYTLTPISEILEKGDKLGNNESSKEYYYVKGTIIDDPSYPYGNANIVDESGNKLYLYGICDMFGNRYDSISEKPLKGDTVVVYACIYKYNSGSTTIIEFKSAVLIDINP